MEFGGSLFSVISVTAPCRKDRFLETNALRTSSSPVARAAEVSALIAGLREIRRDNLDFRIAFGGVVNGSHGPASPGSSLGYAFFHPLYGGPPPAIWEQQTQTPSISSVHLNTRIDVQELHWNQSVTSIRPEKRAPATLSGSKTCYPIVEMPNEVRLSEVPGATLVPLRIVRPALCVRHIPVGWRGRAAKLNTHFR